MKDQLENFFKDNKADFDYLPKESTPSWEQMEGQLDRKKAAPLRLKKYHGWWAAAAAVAALFLFFQPFKTSEEVVEPDYSDMVSLIGLEKDQYFPDLTLQNPEGELIPLSTLNAQVVLVDFWASYSMVCNEENCYHFKPLYNKYRKQGFEIYSVSMDSSAISWKNAIQNDGLDWVQVSDLKGFDSPVIEEYDVEGLTTNYLLDRNGKIMAKNIDVEDLKGELQGIFAMQ